MSIANHHSKTCPKTGKPIKHKRDRWWLFWLFPIIGFFSLIWFLIRVIPKPSRATYPCQRVAFPLACSFITWITGLVGSVIVFGKAKKFLKQSRFRLAMICFAVAGILATAAIFYMPENRVLADEPVRVSPIGDARGVYPGRVVWFHAPEATDWIGPGDGHWWESEHTDQTIVEEMMSRSICALVGAENCVQAWDRIFRYFNQTHGKGDVGYVAGEKITIKVNFVGTIGVWGGAGVDPATYDLVTQMDYMNTSPQMMLALLRQLVCQVGVNESDISIGDTLCYFCNQYYDMCHAEFPDVHYLDYEGKFDRTPVAQSDTEVYWSCDPSGKLQDYAPVSYVEAEYIINMANLKSHSSAGITACAKNHFGSLIRYPQQSRYYDLHNTLADSQPAMGSYRCLVDLMGHSHIGGKTLVYFIDGLYAGRHPVDYAPIIWNSEPFNGDWSSSFFASLDPVAIDSVAFDFLLTEWPYDFPAMAGTDDYLHEAALADDPDSGTFYDPDHSGDVTPLQSLGVHEHWNNSQDKEYSRNLGTGDGIELVSMVFSAGSGDINGDGSVDLGDYSIIAEHWLQTNCGKCWGADFDGDSDIDEADLVEFTDYWTVKYPQ